MKGDEREPLPLATASAVQGLLRCSAGCSGCLRLREMVVVAVDEEDEVDDAADDEEDEDADEWRAPPRWACL